MKLIGMKFAQKLTKKIFGVWENLNFLLTAFCRLAKLRLSKKPNRLRGWDGKPRV